MSSNLHIVIIGAGPGGYVAAIRAAQLGATVTVVDREALGGVCLNWGCIPSKALLSVVDLGDKAKKAADLGLSFGGPATYDLARMVARKNKVVTGLVKGIATLFKHWNINYLEGTARLLDARTVHVALNTGGNNRSLRMRSSSPPAPPGPTFHCFRSTASGSSRAARHWS